MIPGKQVFTGTLDFSPFKYLNFHVKCDVRSVEELLMSYGNISSLHVDLVSHQSDNFLVKSS